MKFKELLRLAFINVKSHKAQSRNMIIGTVVSSVILVPVLFILMSFYAGAMNSVNQSKSIYSVTINYTEDGKTYAGAPWESYDEISALDGIESSTVYSTYDLESYGSKRGYEITPEGDRVYFNKEVDLDPRLVVGDREYSFTNIGSKYRKGLRFFDFDKTDKVIGSGKNQMCESSGAPAILEGKALEGERQSVMLSSLLLDKLGIDYGSVVGKKVSLSVKLHSDFIDEVTDADGNKLTNDYERITVFKDYTVVGVFNKDVYETSSLPSESEYYDYPYVWLNEKDLTDGARFLPEKVPAPDGKGFNFKYNELPTELSRKATEQGYVFLPFGFNVSDGLADEKTQILQFTDFGSLYDNVGALNRLCGLEEGQLASIYLIGFNDVYDDYKTFTIISVILLVCAAVITVTTMIDCYQNLSYLARRRKGFMFMMNAVGMRSKDAIKLFIFEVLILFAFAAAITAVLTLGVSLGLLFWYNNEITTPFMHINIAAPTISFAWYPLALAVALVFMLAITVIIALSCVAAKNR